MTMAYITHQPLTNSQLWPAVPRLLAVLRTWRRRSRERSQLARLGERDLHDLGLSRGAIHAELQKPFWRA
jgi:uncharacterized protein YjiS (DUF1127 family)